MYETLKDLFITTKLWNIHHHPDSVARAIDLSLANLKLDYLGKKQLKPAFILMNRLLRIK